jgi:hypothetical protein
LTAENLISFFKVLPLEERRKFMGLAEKLIEPKKVKFPVKKKPVLTDEDALRYLTTVTFKN